MFNTSTYFNYGGHQSWVLTIQLLSPGETFGLNIIGTSPNINLAWGDGNVTNVSGAGVETNTYASAGTYKVKISGSFPSLDGNIQQIIAPESVIATSAIKGVRGFSSMQSTFDGCSNLTSIPSDLFSTHSLITSFESTFNSCSSLTSIPSGLFDNNPNVTTFNNTFGSCNALTIIPNYLFDNNTLVTDFYATFAGCSSVTSIPTDLFRYNTVTTTFSGVFAGCAGLTSIPTDLFNYNTLVDDFSLSFTGCSGLTSIPFDLFLSNTAVTTFNGTFAGCSSLTTVDGNLFINNAAVQDFSQVFNVCTNLTSVGRLFNYAVNATNFVQAFAGCVKLKQTSSLFGGTLATRFLNQSILFDSMFDIGAPFTGVTGTAPPLWTYSYGTGTPSTSNCWNGHSLSSVSNYASIPAPWL